jgi:hypothetical protein
VGDELEKPNKNATQSTKLKNQPQKKVKYRPNKPLKGINVCNTAGPTQKARPIFHLKPG